jgi:hypothetical protein
MYGATVNTTPLTTFATLPRREDLIERLARTTADSLVIGGGAPVWRGAGRSGQGRPVLEFRTIPASVPSSRRPLVHGGVRHLAATFLCLQACTNGTTCCTRLTCSRRFLSCHRQI